GSFKPNSLGFYDMSGNVVEFVQDWYGEEYYKVSPRNNPQGPLSGEHRVQRGGSWAYVPGAQRAAFRSKVKPFNWSYLYGFRLSLSAQE
ncbi:MAG: formylglycine-generating enzyme family protein, partial [Thermodesulfobacteriota bacterium]